jgi:hypothetical protein
VNVAATAHAASPARPPAPSAAGCTTTPAATSAAATTTRTSPSPPDPLALDTKPQALDHIQHAADLEALKTLEPRERETLYLSRRLQLPRDRRVIWSGLCRRWLLMAA